MERKLSPQEKYNKTNTVTVNLRLMKNTEADIIKWLFEQPNKSGYIKSLIRKDMEEQKAK